MIGAIPRRRFGVFIAIVAMAMASACSRDDAAKDATAQKEEVVVNIATMNARLDQLQQCRLEASHRMGITPSNFASKLADKGVLAELKADAMQVAEKDVAMLERMAPPQDDTAKVATYLNALGIIEASHPNPPGIRLHAKALMAYYESLLTGDACPLDADILKYIGKSEP